MHERRGLLSRLGIISVRVTRESTCSKSTSHTTGLICKFTNWKSLRLSVEKRQPLTKQVHGSKSFDFLKLQDFPWTFLWTLAVFPDHNLTSTYLRYQKCSRFWTFLNHSNIVQDRKKWLFLGKKDTHLSITRKNNITGIYLLVSKLNRVAVFYLFIWHLIKIMDMFSISCFLHYIFGSWLPCVKGFPLKN